MEDESLPTIDIVQRSELLDMVNIDYVLDDEGITRSLKEGKDSTRELVGAMAGKVLGFEPGTRFRYSLCHDVLGALIEIWSGQSLGEYLKKNIKTSLVLAHIGATTYCVH